MSSRNLPPVRNLPHWSRVGFLCKPCAPQPLSVSQRPPAPAALLGRGRRAAGPEEAKATERSPPPPPPAEERPSGDRDPRAASLQKNIGFLQQQHRETLEKLHAEVEELRRANKELQYKLIMDPSKHSNKASAFLPAAPGWTPSRRAVRPPTQGGEAGARVDPEQPVVDARTSQNSESLRPPRSSSSTDGSDSHDSPPQDHCSDLRGALITSLQPLRIHRSPVHPPQPPTLQECEIIIRQLYSANSMHCQEIIRLKSVLRDIVFNKKITPENYILTKAYLADGPRKVPVTSGDKFPQLILKQLSKKTSAPPTEPTGGVVLPALKQTLRSTITERQKRNQALQRNCLKRTIP